jgi:hypothetical protein
MPEPAPSPRRFPFLPTVYLLCLLALCTSAVWRPLTGQDDFWSQAAVGRWMVEHRQVPHETLFLWTASEPWVSHSWLTQLCFHLVVWCLWARHSRISAWTLLLLTVAVVMNFRRYQARPELITAVFLVLLLAFLIGPRRKGWHTAAVYVVLFATWANFHGGVLVGLVILAATVACDLVQDRFGKPARTHAALALLAPAAVCLTPYGLEYWMSFGQLGSDRFNSLSEWWPVWRGGRLPVVELAVQGLFLGLALAAWALNPHRRLAHLAWVLVLAALYLTANRNVWLLTLGSLTVLAANSGALSAQRLVQLVFRRPLRVDAPLLPPLILWVLRLAVVLFVAVLIALRLVALNEWKGAYRPTHLDQGLVQFLRTHQLPGRMFNDFENSRYLEYRLAGRPPLFINVQMAYPDRLMSDYLDVLDATPRSRQLLDDYEIGYVILTTDRFGPRLGPLADLLDGDKGWKCVYSGIDGLVWVRRTPAYAYLWDDPKLAVNSTSFRGWERLFRGNVDPHISFFPE